MSIVKAKTNQYGPATLDIQVEQGDDFIMGVTLKKVVNGTPTAWDLTNATFDAHMSAAWSPGEACLVFTVTAVNLAQGKINISLTAAQTLAPPFVGLPSPPKKTISPDKFLLGGWVLSVTDAGTKNRILEGSVYLDRDPCLT